MSTRVAVSARIDHFDHGPGTKSAETRLRELDGWRAISVLLVITAHWVILQHPGLLARCPELSTTLRDFGPLGVGCFFVISGFVICRLLLREEMRTGGVSLKGFYYRRAFRILPPLFLYLAVIFALISLRLIYDRHLSILSSLLFLCDSNLMPRSWSVAHTWSLAVEEQFYLIFPMAWLVVPRRWRWRTGVAVFLICVVWNITWLFAGSNALVVGSAPFGFACISFGVLMALCEARARALVRKTPASVVALLALLVLLHPVKPDSWEARIFDSLVFPATVGLLLLFSLERGKWFRAFLCSKPMQAVGLTSYGTYLWQELFTASKGSYTPSGHFISFGLPLLLLIVPISYYFIEKPAMRYGKHPSQLAKEASLSGRLEPIG
jgi:peptidoglycan/LPS O-acetylase OafA/YrhL